jgi:hypothetical protein
MQLSLSQRNRARLMKAIAILVGSGTLFSACTTRLRDAVVGGVQEVVLSPDLASAIVVAIAGNDDTAE